MHRVSYWKTTALALAGAASTLSVLVWLNRATGHRGLLAVGALLLVLPLIGFVLIAAGGLVCLWRDARETSGKPDTFAPPAPTIGLLSRVGLRLLLGPALRPGDVVRVRSRDEIEATLDASGALDGLPFMAEMAEYCGRIFRVHRRVDKINDMRNKTGLRRMHDSVTLTGVRCSGFHHDGCQAECQILWKDSWLARLSGPQAAAPNREVEIQSGPPVGDRESGEHDRTYVCQMTDLWEASRPMSSFDLRQDLRPLLWGNVGIRGYLIAILTRIFNKVQSLRGGAGYPFMSEVTAGGGTSADNADLKARETVVIRSKSEIAQTLIRGRNKGLWFDRDMVREDVVATGEFLRLCPQHEYIFWREIWLKRPGEDSPDMAVSDF